MPNRLHSLALLAGLLLATPVWACSKPNPPEIPDPQTAVTPQMIKAKNEVQAYVAEAEKYLKCNISSSQHNKMVDEMKAVADTFNQAVRDYKARMGAS